MQNGQDRKQTPSVEIDTLDLLAKDNYLIVNKTLAEQIGLNEAIVLAELASEARYWKKSGKMENGWFFSTTENLADRLPFGSTTIRRAVKSLEDQGMLTTKVFGMPATKHYKLQFDQIGQTRLTKLDKLDCPNPTTKNKEKNKEEEYIKGADAPAVEEKEKANEPKTYGNQQVNEFLEAWKEETGDDFSKDTRERRATWNLIKGKTSEATKALLTAVGEARRSGDRFAPQIASPSDLVGKYSKINKLRLWVSRNEENEEPHPPYWSWQKLPPQDDLTDEERAATQRAFKEARASGKYKWLKPKEENDAE